MILLLLFVGLTSIHYLWRDLFHIRAAVLFGIVCLLVTTVTSEACFAGEEPKSQAKRIFLRLTGTAIMDADPRLQEMVTAIEAGRPLDAAKIASSDFHFFNATLRNWVAPWSSVSGSQFSKLDDMQATAIGLVRDGLDFRLLLTGTELYVGRPSDGIPAYRKNGNEHYEAIESARFHLDEVLERKQRDRATIGVFGSRGFASAFYSAGTNRRAVRFAFKNFLCKDISSWREPSLPETFIRRDVDRMPSGNPKVYHSECRGCHAPMDALSGAFAYVDFKDDQIQHLAAVAEKFNAHPEVYPDGFEVVDGAWVNFLARNQQSSFGWRSATQGASLAEFARMLGDSRAFSECMVKGAVASTCLKSADGPLPEGLIKEMSDHLESNGYNMRDIFERIAISEKC